MKQRFAFLLVFLLIAASSSGSSVITGEQATRLAISAPPPEYPLEARARHIVGYGTFILHIQIRSGLVRQVEVDQSTGSLLLDSAAVAGLKKWRFKPGTLPPISHMHLRGTYPHASEDSLIRVPINYRIR